MDHTQSEESTETLLKQHIECVEENLHNDWRLHKTIVEHPQFPLPNYVFQLIGQYGMIETVISLEEHQMLSNEAYESILMGSAETDRWYLFEHVIGKGIPVTLKLYEYLGGIGKNLRKLDQYIDKLERPREYTMAALHALVNCQIGHYEYWTFNPDKMDLTDVQADLFYHSFAPIIMEEFSNDTLEYMKNFINCCRLP